MLPSEYPELSRLNNEEAKVIVFFEKISCTTTCLVIDSVTKQAALIDPVLDFDMVSGEIYDSSMKEIIDFLNQNDLNLEWVLDTHIHADHLTASDYLKSLYPHVKNGIGNVRNIQKHFSKLYNRQDIPLDGSQWDFNFSEKDTFYIGKLPVSILETPGHTPCCITYVIGNNAFVGDTIFMNGTARCDFPQGSASTMWESIKKILSLPKHTKIFVGHDYSNPPKWETSVQNVLESNPHVSRYMSKEQYIQIREERDKSLPMPKLLLPSIQINMNGGQLPPEESNGVHFLKIPLKNNTGNGNL